MNLPDLGGSDSGIERLKINSHLKQNCGDPAIDTFTVQVNPEKMDYTFAVEPTDDGDASNGDTGTVGGFKGYVKMNTTFEFWADATGIVPIEEVHKDEFGTDDAPSIRVHLDKLQNVVYGFNRDIHRPPYLSFVWGKIFPSSDPTKKENPPRIFKGVLNSCKVELLLFSKIGEPIKAKITLDISSEMPADLKPVGDSPDISHHINIGYGDKMTTHCNEIYGRYDSCICSAVAEYNNLIDWDLKEGTHMVFPSIHLLNEKYLDDFEVVEVKPVSEETEFEQMVDLIGPKKTQQYFKIFDCKDGSFPEA